MKQETYSEKVESARKKRGISKIDICSALKVTQPTLDSRIKKNDWRLPEIHTLNELLKIRP